MSHHFNLKNRDKYLCFDYENEKIREECSKNNFKKNITPFRINQNIINFSYYPMKAILKKLNILLLHKSKPSINAPPIFNSKRDHREIIPILNSISVIIKTKNAGENFSYVLEKINNQIGIHTLEIIILDFGSTDNTIDYAKKHKAKILNFSTNDFDSKKLIDICYNEANGDFIFLLAQDAIFVSDFSIYDLVKFFDNDQSLAIVTCRQIPCSDADYYDSYYFWNRNAIMDFHTDKIIPNIYEYNPSLLFESRGNIKIDSDCCLFIKSRFKTDILVNHIYKEANSDFHQFGDDFSIGLISSTAIIRSNTFVPVHLFLMGFKNLIGEQSLLAILYEHYIQVFNINNVIGNLIALIYIVQITIYECSNSLRYITSYGFHECFLKALQKNYFNNENIEIPFFLTNDTELDNLIVRLRDFVQPEKIMISTQCYHEYVNSINQFFEFLNRMPLLEIQEHEIVNSIMKHVCFYSGLLIGIASINNPLRNQIENTLNEIKISHF